jgi:hypothetical protein
VRPATRTVRRCPPGPERFRVRRRLYQRSTKLRELAPVGEFSDLAEVCYMALVAGQRTRNTTPCPSGNDLARTPCGGERKGNRLTANLRVLVRVLVPMDLNRARPAERAAAQGASTCSPDVTSGAQGRHDAAGRGAREVPDELSRRKHSQRHASRRMVAAHVARPAVWPGHRV